MGNESHDKRLAELERRIAELERSGAALVLSNAELVALVKGTYRDGKKVDGLMDMMGRVFDAMFGSKDTGDLGLVKVVTGLSNTVRTATIVMITVQSITIAVWMIFTHFHK